MIASRLLQDIQTAFRPNPRCCRKHCSHWAKYLPILRVPAKGCYPENGGCSTPEHEPIAAVIEMPLCERHSNSMNAGEFVTPRMRKKLREVCKSRGKAQPDFSRAFMQRKPLGQDIS